jgi:hypothetical protein
MFIRSFRRRGAEIERLDELRLACLEQDTSISAPRQPGPLGGGRKRRLVVGAAELVALAGVLAAIGRGGPPEVVPNSVIAIAPTSNHIAPSYRSAGDPTRSLRSGTPCSLPAPSTARLCGSTLGRKKCSRLEAWPSPRRWP